MKKIYGKKKGKASCMFSLELWRRKWQWHPSALAWKIPWTEEPGRLQSMGSQRVDMTEQLHFTLELVSIRELEVG